MFKLERTKLGRMFQFEGESISAWECRVVERSKYCEYGNLKIKHVATVLLLVWWTKLYKAS